MPRKPEKLLTIKAVSQMASDEGVSIHDASLNRMVLQGKIPGATTERPGPRGGFARHLIPGPQARKLVENLKLRQKLLETHVTVDDVVKQARGLRELLPHGEERELKLKVNDVFVFRLIKSKRVKGAIRDPASPILKTGLFRKTRLMRYCSECCS